MCDFREPYFKETNEKVPVSSRLMYCGWHPFLNNDRMPDPKDYCAKTCYSFGATGSFLAYNDGQNWFLPGKECSDIFWKIDECFEKH